MFYGHRIRTDLTLAHPTPTPTSEVNVARPTQAVRGKTYVDANNQPERRRRLKITSDSDVLVVMGRHIYLLKPSANPRFHTHLGIIDFTGIVGEEFGCQFKTTTGQNFTVLRPSVRDYELKFTRATQVIYPKDAGAVLMWGNVFNGCRVLESGTGSGALTAVLASAVGESGAVYGFDVRQSSIEQTRVNIDRLGLASRVKLECRDIVGGVDLTGVDSAVLDLPAPWEAVPSVKRSLASDGHLVSFSPTVDQVEKTVEALKDNGFIMVESFELIQRFYDVKPNATRPRTVGVMHTGYLVAARNTASATRIQADRVKIHAQDSEQSPAQFFADVSSPQESTPM
ncbi:MAG: tRNA (adenine-N1)-methyltransferase [Candidatus Marsarchaeota archaeon]|nr:tRNA (adenine-N1)-methyltransferase [Candidatus Marsarchaeota archaeon]